jgi:phosphate acetyltransferase
VVDGTWLHEGEAKQRRILHTSLIASDIEAELHKFVAGELIISAATN